MKGHRYAVFVALLLIVMFGSAIAINRVKEGPTASENRSEMCSSLKDACSMCEEE